MPSVHMNAEIPERGLLFAIEDIKDGCCAAFGGLTLSISSVSMRALACALLLAGASTVLAAPTTLSADDVAEILDDSTRVNITMVRNQAVSASTQRCV